MDATTLSLLDAEPNTNSFAPAMLFPEMELFGGRLPIELVRSRGALLRRSRPGQSRDVQLLNLTNGCAHRSPFCPCRGNLASASPVRFLTGAPEVLAEELQSGTVLPRAVQISPWSDPFLAVEDIQQATTSVVRVLAENNIEAWMMTRSEIAPQILDALLPMREWIKIRIPLATLDESIRHLLEPLSAPSETRLRQIRELKSLGFSVQVALEPLLPGITDTKVNVIGILEQLADLDVRQLGIGYLTLTSGMTEVISELLAPSGRDVLALNPYNHGPVRREMGVGQVRYLAKTSRQRSYAQVMAWGASLGIQVSVSAASNPDFTREVLTMERQEPPRFLSGAFPRR
ncbi:MAG: hypothetical protein ACFCD0_01460 [Gemmataceae bacterium]